MPQGMATWYALAKNPDESTDVTIYDEIGAWGISAKQFIKDLAGVKGHINLRINSPGGSITDGTAIIAALQRHKAGFTAWVDGLAASMASVIACAADQCYMSDGAMMMIHRASTISMGDAADLRKDADLLEKFEKSLVNVYAKKTGLSADEINTMLAAETWLDPLEAIALGFADGISETPAATALLTHEQMRAKFDTFKKCMIEKPVNQDEPAAEPVLDPIVPVVTVEPVAETVIKEPAAEPVLEPVASAKVTDLAARISDMSNQLSLVTAERDALALDIARLEASFGVAAASVLPVIAASENATQSLLERFNAISNPVEKSEFYRVNAAALKREIKHIGTV